MTVAAKWRLFLEESGSVCSKAFAFFSVVLVAFNGSLKISGSISVPQEHLLIAEPVMSLQKPFQTLWD